MISIPDPATTAVLVLGASEWPDAPQFEAAPQFKNSARGFISYICDSNGFALESANLLDLFDIEDEQSSIVRKIDNFLSQLQRELKSRNRALTDVITFYVGHGGFGLGSDSAYFFSIRKTNTIDYLGSSLSAASLRRALKEHAGSARHYLILDCCFAAAAVTSYMQLSTTAQTMLTQVQSTFPPSGTALLCAAGATIPAKAKRDATYTMFSEGLLEVLQNGTPAAAERLTVGDMAEAIRDVLRNRYADEAVRPEVHSPDQSKGSVALVPLFRNPRAALSRRNLIDWAGGERVTLAVVFTDIVGSTVLGIKLGDAQMDDVRHQHFRRSELLVARYGGRQVKTIGDSVMALFHSVGDAFDYAHALHLDPGADELRNEGVRAGIHSGEVRVVENDVYGTEVNFAARVTHAIEGAEIWLSARAREVIGRAGARHQQGLKWQQHDDVELKGFGRYPLWSLIPNSTPESQEPAVASLTAEPAGPQAAAAPPQVQLGLTSLPVRPRSVLPNGRTIFVARPANDMGDGYVRIVDALKGKGFAVIPDGDVPNDDSAVAFIDAALAEAELSIHLLGVRHGMTPDAPNMMPIGKLQLALASLRSQNSEKDEAGISKFRRIIWAPKFLEGAAAAQPAGSVERVPLAVLEDFGEQISGDKVLGENLIQFISFLHQYLDKTRPHTATGRIGIGAKIFIDHSEDDIDYANDLAEALRTFSITARFSVLQGKPSLRAAQNRRYINECTEVALCWGSATEAWVMGEAHKLDQSRQSAGLGQLRATLVAAPPTHKLKDRALRNIPPGVDLVVNLTKVDKPSPQDLREWLRPNAESTSVAAGDG